MLQRGVFLDVESLDNGDLNLGELNGLLPHWTHHAFTAPSEVANRVRDAHLVVVNKCILDRACLEQARSLELIVLCATGTNNVDLEAAAEFDITVCNIRDYCSASLAQHTITLMLNLLTHQPDYLERVRAGEWSRARQFSLHDRTIRQADELTFGVIGYGALGRAAADKARALGMTVLVAERQGAASRTGRVSFDELIHTADVISLHCPLTSATEGLIGRAELAAMKPDALLINTARGGIVDERALARALQEGQIGGAAVDTLGQEPPPPDHPLLDPAVPNLLVTPHNAWASRTARQAAVDQMVGVINAYMSGQAINAVS